jgi:phosphoglycolate phosphatase-like HAD superfamily hydrolase
VAKKRITTVLWDFNGTVIADTQACAEAGSQVLLRFGQKPVSVEVFRKTNFVPSLEFLVANGCNRAELVRCSEEVGEIFHGAYEPRASRVRTRKGVRKALRFLRFHSIPSVIFSNHTEWGVKEQLRRLKLADMFAGVLANTAKTTAIHGRNKKNWVGEFLKSHKLDPQTVVIIGDTDEEIHIGKEFGLITVAVTGGYFSPDRLLQENPDHLIHKVSDLIPIILHENKKLNEG